jgi:hypothetical protein
MLIDRVLVAHAAQRHRPGDLGERGLADRDAGHQKRPPCGRVALIASKASGVIEIAIIGC